MGKHFSIKKVMLKNGLRLFIVKLLTIIYVVYITHKIKILWITWKSLENYSKITWNYPKSLELLYR